MSDAFKIFPPPMIDGFAEPPSMENFVMMLEGPQDIIGWHIHNGNFLSRAPQAQPEDASYSLDGQTGRR